MAEKPKWVEALEKAEQALERAEAGKDNDVLIREAHGSAGLWLQIAIQYKNNA